MPPFITPFRISCLACAIDNRGISLPLSSRTPSTSVSIKSLEAFNALAIDPAAVSALILYVWPSAPRPSGATTGIIFTPNRASSTCLSTLSGIPTYPRSTRFSIALSVSLVLWLSFLAIIRFPSLPEMPTDMPPAAEIDVTRDLFIAPANTISTIEIVC